MINVRRNVGQSLSQAVAFLFMIAVGCDRDDERLVELAREADARQAEQNHEIAQQNHDLSDATNRLIRADSESRKELVALERDVQAERVEVGRQRDGLEGERRAIAQERRWDSAAGEALGSAAILLACLLPLLLCGYVLHAASHSDPDETIGEILTAELVSDDPTFLPRAGSSVGQISDSRNHINGPESSADSA